MAPSSALSAEDRAAQLDRVEERFTHDVAYYRDTEPMTIRGIETVGLGLPAAVLDKILWRNAEAWYPAL